MGLLSAKNTRFMRILYLLELLCNASLNLPFGFITEAHASILVSKSNEPWLTFGASAAEKIRPLWSDRRSRPKVSYLCRDTLSSVGDQKISKTVFFVFTIQMLAMFTHVSWIWEGFSLHLVSEGATEGEAGCQESVELNCNGQHGTIWISAVRQIAPCNRPKMLKNRWRSRSCASN